MDKIKQWVKGTATPLASIFGSGFLVIIPILSETIGAFAFFAFSVICALAYGVGAVIRYNIAHIEPQIEKGTAAPNILLLERFSDIALIPAYIISVSLYLNILSSYGLGYFGEDSPINEKWLTSFIILAILALGLVKGLKILEGLEKWGLMTTLAIIALLLSAFLHYDVNLIIKEGLTLTPPPQKDLWAIITILAGTLIVVQGFEITRYLANQYDAPTRIQASRSSQIISSAIYLLFIALSTPLMHLIPQMSANALLELATQVAFWLALPLVLAACLSQASAAIADMIGASGNMLELSQRRLGEKIAYILIAFCAILLTWSADILEILALASRAFALYYLIQTMLAFAIAHDKREKTAFASLGLVLLFIVIFAMPAG